MLRRTILFDRPARLTASITDGDPVPASAFVTPDGQPGLRADYYNATAATGTAAYPDRPVVTRTERGLASAASQLKEVGERHKLVWTGALVAPDTGTYRLALTGVKGEIQIAGGTPVAATA